MFCTVCGNQMYEGQMFCDKCGTRVSQNNNTNYQQTNQFINQGNWNNVQPYYNNQQGVNDNRNNKKRKTIFVSLMVVAIVAVAITAVLIIKLMKSKADYSENAQNATIKDVKGIYCDNIYTTANSFSDDDYDLIFDYAKKYLSISDINSGSEFKKYLNSELADENEGYNSDFKVIENTKTEFVIKDSYEEYSIKIGEAKEVSNIDEGDIRTYLKFIDEDGLINLVKQRVDKADKVYTVPVSIEYKEYDDNYTETESINDIVCVCNGECYSTIRLVTFCQSGIRYISKSAKSNDVSSAKTIKTAVETAMAKEDIYTYLTGTTGYSYIYVYPGSSKIDDITIDIDYIPDDRYQIRSNDIDGDTKKEVFNNIGVSTPEIRYKEAADPSIGTPKCYVAAINNKGSVRVYISTVESGFYVDSMGNTDYGYELSPTVSEEYQ